MSTKPHLSADSLFTLQECVDARLIYLNKLHDRGLCFGATQPFYENIAKECDKATKARNDIGAIFEAQFPKRDGGAE